MILVFYKKFDKSESNKSPSEKVKERKKKRALNLEKFNAILFFDKKYYRDL